MNRVERLTAILLYLQAKPRTSEEIARRFEVSKRTVLRDVQALSEMGVPVIAREGAGGGYALPEDYRLPPLPLTSREAFLLLLALGSLTGLSDAPYAAERASLEAKLRALLPGAAEPEALLAAVTMDAPARTQRAPHLEALVEALRRGRWVRVEYRSAERQSTQHLFPRRVYEEEGLWYLVAHSREHASERTYRVDRILKLDEVDEAIDPPLYAAMAYDDPAHPLIVATLTARGVALAERVQVVSARVRRLPDGSGRFEGRCPPSDLDWFARFFAGLGDEATVHEPPELVARLRVLGRGLAARHAER